jgi:DNA-directed RNA polymerase specialized sigma24 family protein
MLVAYIRAIVGDQELAREILREVQLVAAAQTGETQTPARMRAMARQGTLDALRRCQAHAPFDDVLLDVFDAQWTACEERHPVGLAAEALRQSLGRLSPTSRRLIQQTCGEGIAAEDIAADLGRPVGSVHRALGRIHRALAGCIRSHQARGAIEAVEPQDDGPDDGFVTSAFRHFEGRATSQEQAELALLLRADPRRLGEFCDIARQCGLLGEILAAPSAVESTLSDQAVIGGATQALRSHAPLQVRRWLRRHRGGPWIVAASALAALLVVGVVRLQRAMTEDGREPPLSATLASSGDGFVCGIDLTGDTPGVLGQRWWSRTEALGRGMTLPPATPIAAGPALPIALKLPNGDYRIELWLVQDPADVEHPLAIAVEGDAVSTLTADEWSGTRHLVHPVQVADGRLDLLVRSHGQSHLMGFSVHRR